MSDGDFYSYTCMEAGAELCHPESIINADAHPSPIKFHGPGASSMAQASQVLLECINFQISLILSLHKGGTVGQP
jgi:hypothetical protein